MALVGDLRDINIPDILRFMKRMQRSGVLKIEGEKKKGEIYFDKGQIIMVSIDDGKLDQELMVKGITTLVSQKKGDFKLEPLDVIAPDLKKGSLDPDEIARHIV